MGRTVYVTCPHCKALIEAEAQNGKVVRHFEPSENNETQDRLLSAMEQIKNEDETREIRFEQSKQEEAKKKDKLRDLFEQEKKRLLQQGDITPEERPFDLD